MTLFILISINETEPTRAIYPSVVYIECCNFLETAYQPFPFKIILSKQIFLQNLSKKQKWSDYNMFHQHSLL